MQGERYPAAPTVADLWDDASFALACDYELLSVRERRVAARVWIWTAIAYRVARVALVLLTAVTVIRVI